jgi:uncharacterized membrane protein
MAAETYLIVWWITRNGHYSLLIQSLEHDPPPYVALQSVLAVIGVYLENLVSISQGLQQVAQEKQDRADRELLQAMKRAEDTQLQLLRNQQASLQALLVLTNRVLELESVQSSGVIADGPEGAAREEVPS